MADYAVCQLACLPDKSTSCGICGQTHAFGECPALSNTRYMCHYVSATQRHHKRMHSDLKRYTDGAANKNIQDLTTKTPSMKIPPNTPPDFCEGKEKLVPLQALLPLSLNMTAGQLSYHLLMACPLLLHLDQRQPQSP